MAVEPEKNPYNYLKEGLLRKGIVGPNADNYCDQLRITVNRDFREEFIEVISKMLAGPNRSIKAGDIFNLSNFTFYDFARERADRILEGIDETGRLRRW